MNIFTPRHKRAGYNPAGNWRDMRDWIKRMSLLNPLPEGVPQAKGVKLDSRGRIVKSDPQASEQANTYEV